MSTIEVQYSLFQFISNLFLLPILLQGPPHTKLLVQDVQSLLQVGAIEEVLQNLRRKCLYSHYFLIPKIKGGLRPILDVCQLNSYLEKIKYCMVTLGSIILSLETGTLPSI